jgi:toxin ParE1/3/4
VDYEVVWSPAALDDVEYLAEYIARDSEFYARAVVDKILDMARKLKDFPSA